jgi:lipid II:glycine glycyltransferase (peptidoglycan interpeptide bridge formation enzyme)
MTSQAMVFDSLKELGFHYEKVHGDFLTNLERTPPGKIWSDVFGKHDRQAVKYFEGLGAVCHLSNGDEEFRQFLRLHENTMLREGYRPMAEEFLSLMKQHLGDSLQLAFLAKPDEVFASQLLILDRANKTAYIDKIGYSRFRNIHSSVVALWFRICDWADRNGFRYVNFGGVRSDVAFRLKSKFGGEFVQYYLFVIPSASVLYPAAAGLLKGARKIGQAISGGT